MGCVFTKLAEEDYMSKIYKKYMNRSRVYGRSLDGFDVDVSAIEAAICKDPTKCSHPYLNKWDGEYLCMDCWKSLNTCNAGVCTIIPGYAGVCTIISGYAERIAREEELENNTPVDKIPEGLSEKERNDMIGKNSSMRGVKIGFLLEFSKKYNCWTCQIWRDVFGWMCLPFVSGHRIVLIWTLLPPLVIVNPSQ